MIRLVVLVALFISGCSFKAENIKTDGELELTPGRGYLLLGVDTDISLNKLVIVGEQNIFLTYEDLQRGSNYLLVQLDEGDYKISRVHLNYRYYFSLHSAGFDFTVTPGVINYVGDMWVERAHLYGRGTQFHLLNKSSIALEYMQENFSQLISQGKLVYAGPGEDHFLEYAETLLVDAPVVESEEGAH